MKEADFDYLRNINTRPGPNAGHSIDPTKPGPDADRIAGLTLERGTLIEANSFGKHNYRLAAIDAELSRLRNEHPLSSMIGNLRAVRDSRHGSELVAALRDHNVAVVNLRDSAADEIERLLPAPSLGLQGVREAIWKELSDIAAAIGSDRFLDPPDGGDVSLAEQVKRMRQALNAAEAALAQSESPTEEMIEAHFAALEAAAAQSEAEQSEAEPGPQDVREALLKARRFLMPALDDVRFDLQPGSRTISALENVLEQIDSLLLSTAFAQSDAEPDAERHIESYRNLARRLEAENERLKAELRLVSPFADPDASGLIEAAAAEIERLRHVSCEHRDRADNTEADLTAERQRREYAEAALLHIEGNLIQGTSSWEAARAYFARYEGKP